MSNVDPGRNGWNDFDIQDRPDFRDPSAYPSHHPYPEEEMVLAMSYVKRQKWGEVFDCEAGLARGTIFPELEKPFLGKGGCGR